MNKYNHTSRSNLQEMYCYMHGRSENWQDPSEWKKFTYSDIDYIFVNDTLLFVQVFLTTKISKK